jgi:hypothetical protein
MILDVQLFFIVHLEHFDRVSHRHFASRNPQLKADYHQNIYFRVPDVVTIDLNTSLEHPHSLEENLHQS